MSRRRSRSFPVTVTQMPTVRCKVCGATLAHLRGEAGRVLTAHYEAAHAAVLRRGAARHEDDPGS